MLDTKPGGIPIFIKTIKKRDPCVYSTQGSQSADFSIITLLSHDNPTVQSFAVPHRTCRRLPRPIPLADSNDPRVVGPKFVQRSLHTKRTCSVPYNPQRTFFLLPQSLALPRSSRPQAKQPGTVIIRSHRLTSSGKADAPG